MVSEDPPSAASRLPRGELISAASALSLLAIMFGLKWYGIAEGSGRSALRSGLSSAQDAWHGLTLLRWLMLLTIVVAIGSLLIHISQRSHGTQTDTSPLVTALGGLSGSLLAYRVLIDLPSPEKVVDQKLGAFLGVVCAFGIALGGWESTCERRNLKRSVVHRARA